MSTTNEQSPFETPLDHGHAEFASEDLIILGTNVQKFRERQGLSQARLSQIADISRPTIVHIEQGQEDVLLTTLRKLADALGVELIDLLTPPK